jgi:hypothetical protein
MQRLLGPFNGKPLALFGYGYKCWHDIEDNFPPSMEPLDFTQDFPEKLGVNKVFYKEDGTFVKTQIAVLSQHHAADVLNKAMWLINEGAHTGALMFVAGKCNKSCHRTDVMFRCLENVCNQMLDSHGDRVWNAKLFSALHKKTQDEALLELESAVEWSESSRCQMPSPTFVYGFEAVERRTACRDTFTDFFEQYPWSRKPRRFGPFEMLDGTSRRAASAYIGPDDAAHSDPEDEGFGDSEDGTREPEESHTPKPSQKQVIKLPEDFNIIN